MPCPTCGQPVATDAPAAPRLYTRMNLALSGLKANFDAFLAAHPGIKNCLDGLVKTGMIAGLTYVATALKPDYAAGITEAGLSAAVMQAVKSYSQHQLDTFLLGDASVTPKVQMMIDKGKKTPQNPV